MWVKVSLKTARLKTYGHGVMSDSRLQIMQVQITIWMNLNRKMRLLREGTSELHLNMKGITKI